MNEKKHSKPFTPPKDYFEELEDNILAHIELEDTIPQHIGFSVPDNYFSQLEASVMDLVEREEFQQKNTKVIPLFRNKKWLTIASVAACLVFMATLFLIPSEKENDTIALSEINDYINDGNLDLDTYELELLLDESAVENLETEQQTTSALELEDYLLDNLNDNSLLLE